MDSEFCEFFARITSELTLVSDVCTWTRRVRHLSYHFEAVMAGKDILDVRLRYTIGEG